MQSHNKTNPSTYKELYLIPKSIAVRIQDSSCRFDDLNSTPTYKIGIPVPIKTKYNSRFKNKRKKKISHFQCPTQ
jgi:hypothetical protein